MSTDETRRQISTVTTRAEQHDADGIHVPTGASNQVRARYIPTDDVVNVYRHPRTGKIHLIPLQLHGDKRVIDPENAGDVEVLE